MFRYFIYLFTLLSIFFITSCVSCTNTKNSTQNIDDNVQLNNNAQNIQSDTNVESINSINKENDIQSFVVLNIDGVEYNIKKFTNKKLLDFLQNSSNYGDKGETNIVITGYDLNNEDNIIDIKLTFLGNSTGSFVSYIDKKPFVNPLINITFNNFKENLNQTFLSMTDITGDKCNLNIIEFDDKKVSGDFDCILVYADANGYDYTKKINAKSNFVIYLDESK